MKLPDWMTAGTINDPPRRAPLFVMWMPPNGAAMECSSLEIAQIAAVKFAARHPGSVVAVYQLVGFTYQPIVEPDFTPTGPGAEEQGDVLKLPDQSEAEAALTTQGET